MKKHLLTICLVLGLAFSSVICSADDSMATVAPQKKKARTWLAAGDMATDFTVIGPKGEKVSLSDFRGKIVVLDFWATWCGPCLKSMPHYSELAETHAKDGLVVLSVCVADTREKYDQWITDNGSKYAFQTAHDPVGKKLRNSMFSSVYGVSILPTVFVVDRDGRIVGRVAGTGDDSNLNELLTKAGLGEETAEEAVEKVVAKEPPVAPKPLFRETLGKIKSGDPMRDVMVETVDGESVKLADLVGSGPMVLTIFSMTGLAEDEIEFLNGWAERYAEQGVSVVGLAAYGSRAQFDELLTTIGDKLKFTVVFDPVGPSPTPSKPKDEMSDEEVAAYKALRSQHYGKVVPMALAGGLMAPVPHTLIIDNEYKFLAIYQRSGPQTSESLGNLMLRAGVSLEEADRPAYVFTAAETAPAPREETVPLLKAGMAAPDFTAIDIDGKKVKISDYRGKVVVLDFWATWCGPCMKAMPHIQDVASTYKEQGVVVLGSGTRDKRSAFEKWIRINGAKYPDIIWAHDPADRGPERASRALYGVAGIPTQFIIGRDGNIVEVITGYLPGEVLLDAALSKAGIDVPEEILLEAEANRRHRERL